MRAPASDTRPMRYRGGNRPDSSWSWYDGTPGPLSSRLALRRTSAQALVARRIMDREPWNAPRWSYSSANSTWTTSRSICGRPPPGRGAWCSLAARPGLARPTLVDEFCRQVAGDSGGAADLVRCALHAGSARSRARPGARARPPHRPARPRRRRAGSALPGGACGLRRAAGTDGHHRRRCPLGRRRLARAAPLPRPAHRRSPGPLRRHLSRRRDRGRSPPPPGPGRSGDGASRPSHQRPPVVGSGGAADGGGQRPRRRRPCTG